MVALGEILRGQPLYQCLTLTGCMIEIIFYHLIAWFWKFYCLLLSTWSSVFILLLGFSVTISYFTYAYRSDVIDIQKLWMKKIRWINYSFLEGPKYDHSLWHAVQHSKTLDSMSQTWGFLLFLPWETALWSRISHSFGIFLNLIGKCWKVLKTWLEFLLTLLETFHPADAGDCGAGNDEDNDSYNDYRGVQGKFSLPPLLSISLPHSTLPSNHQPR